MTALKNSKGFSLVELMTILGIVAILSAIAIPNMISWLSSKGLQSAARDLYSNLRKAQSNAVKRNRNCAVTFDGTTGYRVYVDENKNFSFDAGELIIAEVKWAQYRNVQFDSVTFQNNSAGSPTIAIQPNLIPVAYGGLIPNGTVKVKNDTPKDLSVTVSITGNISLN